MHARATRRFLHIRQLHFLLIELLLELRYTLQLSRLKTAVWSFVLRAAVSGMDRRIHLVDPRLQTRHAIFLRQDLPFPLSGDALFG